MDDVNQETDEAAAAAVSNGGLRFVGEETPYSAARQATDDVPGRQKESQPCAYHILQIF
jgi:hypothetical protein